MPDPTAALRMRRYRQRLRQLRPAPDSLAVTCWCESSIGEHPTRDIRAGSTFSCGPRCKPAA